MFLKARYDSSVTPLASHPSSWRLLTDGSLELALGSEFNIWNQEGGIMLLFDQLTRREEEILALVANGYQNIAIAHTLDISVYTVQNHLQNLFKRLGVRNRTQAASKYWQRVA